MVAERWGLSDGLGHRSRPRESNIPAPEQPFDELEGASVVGWGGRKNILFALNGDSTAIEKVAAQMALETVAADDPYRGLVAVVHYSSVGRDLAGWIIVAGYPEAVLRAVCEEIAEAKPGWLVGAMRKSEAGDFFVHVLVPDPGLCGLDLPKFLVLMHRLATELNSSQAGGRVRYLQCAPANVRLLQEAVYGTLQYVPLSPADVTLLRAADALWSVDREAPGQLLDRVPITLGKTISDSEKAQAEAQIELPGIGPGEHSQVHLGVEWHWHSLAPANRPTH